MLHREGMVWIPKQHATKMPDRQYAILKGQLNLNNTEF